MKFICRVIEFLFLAALACCILFLPQAAVQGVTTGLKTCAAAILPSLFPFFVLTDYWVNSGYADTLAHLTAPLMEQSFHLPGSISSAFVLGCIGGYPVGAKTIAQLYDQKQITKEQAEQAACFCNNAGPAFVLGVLGNGVFQNTLSGICLYLIHLIAAYCVGIFLRRKSISTQSIHASNDRVRTSVSQRLTQSIRNGGNTLIMVCTYVLLFAILTQCLRTLLPAGAWFSVLSGVLELAGGASVLASESMSQQGKFILAAFLLGFGGFCVMLQSLSVLQAAGLSGKKLILGKFCHGILSAIFATIFSPILPAPHPCAMASLGVGNIFFQQASIALLLLLIMFRFLKESSGNMEKNRI